MFRLPIVKFFSRILNRITITVVLVALQVAWLLWAFFSLTTGRVWVNAGLQLLSLFMMLYLVRKDENSAYKIGWIALMGVLPLLGGALYLSFGNKRPAKQLRSKLQAVDDAHKADLVQQPGQTDGLDASGLGMSRYLARYGRYPAWKNTAAQYFACGEAMYPQLLRDLERAEHTIFVEYFILHTGKMWDGVEAILRRKAAQGVDVRLIYDDFGSLLGLPTDFVVRMERAHIRCIPFNPVVPVLSLVMNHRDHRKIVVIDGTVAYTGGVNLADEYINELERFGRWKDCGILVRGKAVWSMTVMFLSLWGYVDRCEEDVSRFHVACAEKQGGTGFLQPFADSPLDNEDVGATMLQSVISSAQERMWIMTPYLILDDKMTTALCVAAKTGVDVRIITPAIPDKWYVHAVTRANYEELTRAGVRIYEYTPGFIHSKVYLADSVQAVVGTVNLDFRSLYLHFEDAVYLCDTAANAQIEEDFVQTFPQCRAITYEQCRHVHLYQRILRALLRMFAPLM